MRYLFKCNECSEVFEKFIKAEEYYIPYHCGVVSKRIFTTPNIHGTRDGFGFKNQFTDEKSGEVIDSWKKWERAGYSDPLNTMKGDVKEKTKEQIEKCKRYNKKSPSDKLLSML